MRNVGDLKKKGGRKTKRKQKDAVNAWGNT